MVKSNHHIASVNIVLVIAVLAIGFMFYSTYSPNSQVSTLDDTIEESSALAGQASLGKSYGKSGTPPFNREIIADREEEEYYHHFEIVKADRTYSGYGLSFAEVKNSDSNLGEIYITLYTGSAMSTMASGTLTSERITAPSDLSVHYKLEFEISDLNIDSSSVEQTNFICKLDLNEYDPITGEFSVISSWLERFGSFDFISRVEIINIIKDKEYEFVVQCYFNRLMTGYSEFSHAKITLVKLFIGESLAEY